MSPTENLLQITPSSVYNVTQYYTTCAGTNPMSADLVAAEDLIRQGEVAVRIVLRQYCPGDPYLEDALTQISRINNIFGNITTLIACEPNQEQLQSVLNDGFCGDVFKGVYTIWVSQYFCGAVLLVCSIIASCAYPHFNKAANTNSNDGAAPPAGVAGNSSMSTIVGGSSVHPSAPSLAAGEEQHDEFYYSPHHQHNQNIPYETDMSHSHGTSSSYGDNEDGKHALVKATAVEPMYVGSN